MSTYSVTRRRFLALTAAGGVVAVSAGCTVAAPPAPGSTLPPAAQESPFAGGSTVSYVNPFLMPGSWYKGGLHVHTTRSDGKLTPAQTVDYYRDRGYQFLSVSDHDTITDLSAQSTPGFLNIPGVEVSHGRNGAGETYHVLLFGIREMIRVPNTATVQEFINQWAEKAQVLILAHAYWSGMVNSELLPLERMDGMEIFNTSSQTDLGKGLATVHWDDLLVRGKQWWGFAVDDTHGVNDDAAGGWIVVKSEKLDESSIVQAMKSGAFYSSSSPEIYDFRIEDGVAKVRCSPVTTINFISRNGTGFQRRADPGRTVTHAEYALKGVRTYLRVECMDGTGHVAWTNPVYLP